MKYRIFLSDFDGTLVRSDGTVSSRNRRAIQRYREAGGVFAIVTGRELRSIRPRLAELGLTEGLAVSFQGSVISDIATGKFLKTGGFSTAGAVRVLKELEARKLHIHIYSLENFYCNMNDEALKLYEDVCKIKATVVEDEPLSRMVERTGEKIVKMLIMAEKEDAVRLFHELPAALGEEYCVTRSAEFLVEILPAGENKGRAVEFLSEYYAVPQEEIAAIGDNLNDLPLLEAAGGRFAVGNAEAELKEKARVVPSCEEDGVAYALEYVMGEEV